MLNELIPLVTGGKAVNDPLASAWSCRVGYCPQKSEENVGRDQPLLLSTKMGCSMWLEFRGVFEIT